MKEKKTVEQINAEKQEISQPTQSISTLCSRVPHGYNGWYHGMAVNWKKALVLGQSEIKKTTKNLARLRSAYQQLVEFYK